MHWCAEASSMEKCCITYKTVNDTFVCSVFSFQYHFAVIFDTTQLSGENDTLQFLIQAKR